MFIIFSEYNIQVDLGMTVTKCMYFMRPYMFVYTA